MTGTGYDPRHPTLKQFLVRKAFAEFGAESKGTKGVSSVGPGSANVMQQLKGLTAEKIAQRNPEWVEEYKEHTDAKEVGRLGDDTPKCSLDRLKKFIAQEGRVLIVVRKGECPKCDSFEGRPLPKFLEEEADKSLKGVALGMVGIDDKDPECNRIVQEFKLLGAPAVLAFKDGKEVDRATPDGLDSDVEILRRMAKKIE